jgi:tripartite-type tricarboxylate transporter receptor subunit TctC
MKTTLMKTISTHGFSAVALALAFATSALAADAFPSKPIHLVVNTAPGGLTDVTTRLVGQKMAEKLGQPVIVDNRPGADGLIGIRFVKAASADGYTLLATAGTIAIQPAVKQDPGYDLMKDFTGVGPMVRAPLLMVVGPGQPDKTVADFIARAKANPDKLSYASAGVGTTTHVGAAMFLQQSNLNLLHVPYKGNGAAIPDVIGGRVSMIFEAYGSGLSKVKSGKLRALGVTSTTRLAALPEIPTIAEQGVPNFSYYLYIGVLAPAGTPKDVVQRLSEALRSATSSNDLKGRFREEGSEPMTMSPEEFTEFLRRDAAQMSKLVADLKLPKQ